MLKNKTILITGGTGSYGKAFVKELLDNHSPKAVRILSRDELKQWEMDNMFRSHPQYEKLRFFIGDVRDKNRLYRAFEGVDIVVHAAALKQVPTAEYNPSECISTNVMGAQNVIDAALDTGVSKVVALSTDKASSPINLYGATKLCSDKLFIAANNIRGKRKIAFSVVRYGNVMGSRGSVIPFFIKKREEGMLPITHKDMTRFNITLKEAGDFVLMALEKMMGGEIFVPIIPSYRIMDLAEAISPSAKKKIVGLRPGEKIHEEMIPETEALNTIKYKDHFTILPADPRHNVETQIKKYKGKRVREGFCYNSGENTDWLTVAQIQKLIKKHVDPTFKPV